MGTRSTRRSRASPYSNRGPVELPEGIVAVVKQECPTCQLVEPVLGQLATDLGGSLTVFSQDEPSFPATVQGVRDDTALEVSWGLDLTTVPTLVKVADGKEVDR